MARNAFLDGLAAYDVAFKREEAAGRNFFADAMDANRVNNLMLNDAVTRAFNQQTIDQKGQQFPYTLAGLSRTDEIARLMQPANAAMTGVTANYLVDQAGNGAYGAQIANRFNLQGVLGATNLTNAQTAAQNAEFTNAYVNKDPAALGALMGIPTADIAFDLATGVATQVSTGKTIHPQGFNVAMSQLATKSAAEQAAYIDRMNAVKAMLTPGASSLPTAPTMSMANKFNVATPAVAADAVPNTPDIKDAAGMPSMINQTNADMLQMFNRNVAPFMPPATTAATAAATVNPELVKRIADYRAAGLTTVGLETELARQQRVSDIVARSTPDARNAEFDATRTLMQGRYVAGKVASDPNGHIPLTEQELLVLQNWVNTNPADAEARGLDRTKMEQVIKYNAFLRKQR